MNEYEIKKIKRKRRYKGLYFVAPWVIGFAIFGLLPMIASLYMSMTDWGIAGPVTGFVGLDNYTSAILSENFWSSLIITVKFAVFAVPLGMLSALIAALLLSGKSRGIKYFKAIYYVPVISSGVAIAVMWKWILAPDGLLNSFLGLFNVDPIFWLNDPEYVIPSYIIIATWGAFSGYLTYLVAMKDVPESLYESAKISGVSWMSQLFKITIPLMRPILTYNLIMAIIASFRKFNEAYILGGAGGQGKFYMVYFYEVAFTQYKMGYAIALAWILVIIILVLTSIVYKYTPFWDYYKGTKEADCE